MVLVYSPRYTIDIGPHVFITDKYRLVHDRLLQEGAVTPDMVVEPSPASWDDLALVHDPEYLDKLRSNRLTPAETATLELPGSPEVVEGFRLMTGGTMLAASLALEQGLGVHIGGGLHHAFRSHGEGFCVFNDIAVSIERLVANRRIRRAAVVDLDVHQGNGTAAVFGLSPHVFTFSMHQQHNYPFFKPVSTLDIGFADGTGDDEYLARLDRALPDVVAFAPDLAIYVAGADPYEHDQLGGLSLTMTGLRERDRRVFRALRQAGVPVAVTLAGGYARQLADTVSIHKATVEEALSLT